MWLNRNRIHILVWSIYIVYESVIVGFISGQFGRLENYIVHYTLNISFFYLHDYLLSRLGFKNRKSDYLKILTLCSFEIIAYVVLLAMLNHFFTHYNQPNSSNVLGIDEVYVLSATYRCLFFIIISSGYWFSRRYFNEQKKTEALERFQLQQRIEKEKIQKDLVIAQNAFLRTQINPHFFFNTLSFVRGRIRKTDPVAGDIIVGLAEMMRYATEIDYTREFISLRSEIEQVENLMAIFQAKNDTGLHVQITCLPLDVDCFVIPLALMTLVENVFKHGVITDQLRTAKILIRQLDDRLIIETENYVADHALSPSLKTGLTNLKGRLLAAYGKDLEFNYGGNQVFMCRLSVPWKAIC